jgi:hypothetical protein
VPVSYGAASPTTAPAPSVQSRELGIDDPHPLVSALWGTVQDSAENRYYSEADWARLRLELWFANEAMSDSRPPSGHTWQAIQRGLSELLVSPAAKRRAAIDLKPPGPDADEDAKAGVRQACSARSVW